MIKELKLVGAFIFFICMNVYSQSPMKRHYLKLNNENDAPEFIYDSNLDKMVYSGTDPDEQNFFSQYIIKSFTQAFPNSKKVDLLKGFFIESTSTTIGNDLLIDFPNVYNFTEEITEYKDELSSTPYTPDDYISSTFQAAGNFNLYDVNDFEDIGTPKAWGITSGGSKDILIGISDGKVDNTLLDLDENKVSYINYGFTNTAVSCDSNYPALESRHGSAVSIIAAGEGDNNNNSLGVCYNCEILSTNYGSYNNLLVLAENGARVINMSWISFSSQNPKDLLSNSTFWSDRQAIINEIKNDYGVVLVAAAGNTRTFDANGPNIIYGYPASLDNVISVSGVNHWFDIGNYPYNTAVSSEGRLSVKWIKNSISQRVDITDPDPVGLYTYIDGVDHLLTYNDEVDIVTPAYKVLSRGALIYNCTNLNKYVSATSPAAPQVTGTVGLMFSVNDCLTPNQVEDILKLTSRDIEYNLSSNSIELASLNQHFTGLIGAGKHESGNAVEFVDEISKVDGVAEIKDHIFTRYSFNLDNILNELEIENVRFVQNSSADFTAKNSIELLEGTVLEPGNDSYVELNIDSNISACIPNSSRKTSNSNNKDTKADKSTNDLYKVFPTIVETVTKVTKNKNLEENVTSVYVYDLLGIEVTSLQNITTSATEINLSNLKSGIYILIVIDYTGVVLHTQKIIKK